jgi:hypothetical protein
MVSPGRLLDCKTVEVLNDIKEYLEGELVCLKTL